jgi:hypothetical protein
VAYQARSAETVISVRSQQAPIFYPRPAAVLAAAAPLQQSAVRLAAPDVRRVVAAEAARMPALDHSQPRLARQHQQAVAAVPVCLTPRETPATVALEDHTPRQQAFSEVATRTPPPLAV